MTKFRAHNHDTCIVSANFRLDSRPTMYLKVGNEDNLPMVCNVTIQNRLAVAGGDYTYNIGDWS